MHREAEVVLPALLQQAGFHRPVLLGQSDGASIAIIYAAKFPDSAAALILEAPHVFVEDLTVESIRRAKATYGQLAAIQARIPAAQVCLFAHSKHAPHRDQPQSTLRRIAGFVESLPGE